MTICLEFGVLQIIFLWECVMSKILGRFAAVEFGVLLMLIAGPAQAAALPAVWTKGRDITGTCHAIVGGQTVMNGSCNGAGHGNSVVVTAEHNGCTIELTRRGAVVTGKIFAYKDTCGAPNSTVNNSDVDLGRFTVNGNCWHSTNAQICLQSGRKRD